MPSILFPRAFEQMINEDIDWLKGIAPDCLERDHIIHVLLHAALEYRVRGYDEAVNRTGPHHATTPPPSPPVTAATQGSQP